MFITCLQSLICKLVVHDIYSLAHPCRSQIEVKVLLCIVGVVDLCYEQNFDDVLLNNGWCGNQQDYMPHLANRTKYAKC